MFYCWFQAGKDPVIGLFCQQRSSGKYFGHQHTRHRLNSLHGLKIAKRVNTVDAVLQKTVDITLHDNVGVNFDP